MATAQTGKFFMAGTEGTGAYTVYAVTVKGRLGVRKLGGGNSRVRVEPVTGFELELAATLTRAGGWKQPGDEGQKRFSKVVGNVDDLSVAVMAGLEALGQEGLEIGPDCPDIVRVLLEPAGSEDEAADEVAESDHPAALRAEASVLREEAEELLARATELDQQAEALEAEQSAARTAAVAQAKADLADAIARLKALGEIVTI